MANETSAVSMALASLDWVRRESTALLRRAGVDVAAIMPILQRQDLDVASEIRFWWRLAEARIWLPPRPLLRLFEVRPFRELEQQIAVTDYLADRMSPTRSRDELRGLLTQFITHLEHATAVHEWGSPKGHPSSTFERFGWLQRLSATYPSRQPRLMPWGKYARWWQSWLHYTFEYRWPEGGGVPLRTIDEQAAARLDGLRSTVHEIKMASVRRLSECVTVTAARSALPELIASIRARLTPVDVNFLFSMDRELCAVGEPGLGEPGTGESGTGGLTELITVCGHVEAEAALGLFHAPRVELGARLRLEPSHTDQQPACNYFELHASAADNAHRDAAEPDEWLQLRRLLADACERFLTAQGSFWSAFSDRANEELTAAFGRMPKGSPPRYEARIRTFDAHVGQLLHGDRTAEIKRSGHYRRARVQAGRDSVGVAWGGRWDLIHGGADAKRAFDRLLDEEAQTTLTEVARRVGVGKATLSGRFRTQHGISIGYLAKLADAVGRYVALAFPPKGPGDRSP